MSLDDSNDETVGEEPGGSVLWLCDVTPDIWRDVAEPKQVLCAAPAWYDPRVFAPPAKDDC